MKKQLIDPNDIHTAIGTWSGFIYQGKVALYHVLWLLNKNENNLKYYLQLDSLEDFAIVDKEINPITLHQVKALKSKLYSSYKNAFEKLEKRTDEFSCDRAYFHFATQNEKSITEIKKRHPKMDIYDKYGDYCFCPLEEIDDKCEREISKYLKKQNLIHFDNQELRTIFRNNLESKINGQIIEIHSNNHKNDIKIREGAYYLIIPLTDFKSILESNPQKSIDSEDYYFFLTKSLLNKYYTEFCLETSEEFKCKNKIFYRTEKEKLSDYLQQINNLGKNSLLKFIQDLLPNRKITLNTVKDFKDFNIQNDEFKDVFLQILLDLVRPSGEIGQDFSWNGTDNLRYTATAINSGQNNKHKICKRIFKNISDIDIDVPYEANKLITSSIDVESLKSEINLQNEIEEDNSTLTNNIIKWNDIGLVSLNVAKKIIK